jgi:ABC-type phosphate transport system substrate-binding protein
MRNPRIVALLLLLLSSSTLRADENYRIIVNAKNPIESLDRKFLADTYLKRIKHWPGNGVIQPVDLAAESSTRRKFCEEVLNRSVMGVKNYWQQAIFSGRDVPPPELASEVEVIRFVAGNPASIGYVSNATISASGNTGEIKIVNLK